MLVAMLVTLSWAFMFFLVLLVPIQHRWKDNGDCRGLVWHTVRNPTNLERFTMWRSKSYIAEDTQ
jgi:hypothetical protein